MRECTIGNMTTPPVESHNADADAAENFQSLREVKSIIHRPRGRNQHISRVAQAMPFDIVKAAFASLPAPK